MRGTARLLTGSRSGTYFDVVTVLLDAQPSERSEQQKPTTTVISAAPAPTNRRNTAVQGLRAVAVLAVVGDHLVQRPSGGFVGVDVFFVISGFLITGLLLREVDRNGRIDVLGFYKRRIKRTLPLAAAVILVTLLVGTAVFPAYRAAQLDAAAKAAATFSINWQLIDMGTDYLHATDLPTPLQHFWSLAVEEQFYLVWPALLVGTLFVARRIFGRHWNRRTVGVLAVVMTAGSAAWCMWQTSSDPTAAYFSTASRGWELGVGALLAAGAPVLRRFPRSLAPALGWVGLIALGAAFFIISPQSAFPAPWVALPVLATAAVIIATETSAETQLYPLTNRASQYIGDLSYSIYLWHYPVVIFASALLTPSKGSHLIEVVIMGGLSVLSYHLLETPLRRASWRGVVSGRFREGVRPTIPTRRLVVAGVAVAIAGVLAPAFVSSSTAQAVPMGDLFSSVSTTSARPADLSAVRVAADSTAWPSTVTTAIRDQTQLLPSEWLSDGCLWMHDGHEDPAAIARLCTFGSPTATHTAVLYGDSIAISYYTALRRALPSQDWRIVIMTAEQCPAFAMTVGLDDGSPYPQCGMYRSWALAHVRALKPDLVVAASSYSALWRWKGDTGAANAVTAWTDGARSTVSSLAKSSQRVLVLDAPQMGQQLRDCLTPIASPQQCATAVDQSYVDATSGAHAALAPLVAQSEVLYPSTLTWYCTATGTCPSFVDGEPTLADGMHPSTLDAPRIGRLISRALATR